MSYIALINRTHIGAVAEIPAGLTDVRMAPIIRRAQEVDLKPFLGAAFYADLLANVSGAEYLKLLDGTTYVNEHGDTIEFGGLRLAISCFFMSRFYGTQQETLTSHSLVTKITPFSEPIDGKQLGKTQAGFRSDALQYWKEAECYLNHMHETFTKWKCTGERKAGHLRINSVGGSSHRDCGPRRCRRDDDENGYYERGYLDNGYFN